MGLFNEIKIKFLKKKRMRIGIDIDDTLAETTHYIMPILVDFDKNSFNGNGIAFPNKKHMVAFDWSADEIIRFRDSLVDEDLLNIPPKKDAAKYVELLKKLGHEIIIITARSDDYFTDPYKLSNDWLLKNNIIFDKLLVGCAKKGEICKEERIDLMIDDSFGQASYIALNNKIPVLMPEDDYNKDKEAEGIRKVYSWEDIYNIIIELNK